MNDRRRITGVVTSNKMTKTWWLKSAARSDTRLPQGRSFEQTRQSQDELGCQIATRFRSWKAARFRKISVGG